ncbi:MAG: methyltransferase domain-containing protein [Bacteroidales bacterium]
MSIKSKIKENIKNYFFPIPAELKKNHIYLTNDKMNELEQSIRKNFHTGWRSEDKFTPEAYKEDLKAHLINRLEDDRRRIIPWLNAASPLKGKKILEIGCGTGSSSIALAEQGAIVTGIDLDADALKVAEDRKRIYNLDIRFEFTNAVEVHERYAGENFDFIIFFATIEHMIHEERMSALKTTWEMLKPGSLWVVLETPNRLWYLDGHTSGLPFFQWLPDDLAFKYSKFSPRKEFSGIYREYNSETGLHFLRRGRGLSFHEFDLTMGQTAELNIVSSKVKFEHYEWLRMSKIEKRFKSFLKSAYPGLHDGFYDKSLDLIIRKK